MNNREKFEQDLTAFLSRLTIDLEKEVDPEAYVKRALNKSLIFDYEIS
jgi:hypothetical protein